MPVNVPQAQQRDNTGKLLTVGGAVVGGVGGGPQGALQGASAGSMAGSLVAQQPAQTQMVQTNSGAMQRRLQELDQLRQADTAVAQLPPQQQQQYGPAIRRARIMAEQQEGYA